VQKKKLYLDIASSFNLSGSWRSNQNITEGEHLTDTDTPDGDVCLDVPDDVLLVVHGNARHAEGGHDARRRLQMPEPDAQRSKLEAAAPQDHRLLRDPVLRGPSARHAGA
jgi:hypothetical protein